MKRGKTEPLLSSVGQEAKTTSPRNDLGTTISQVQGLNFRRPGARRVSAELAVRLAAADHLLAIAIQGVVHNRLGRDDLMIVLVTEVAEPLGDGVQPCRLRLVPESVIRIGPVDDLSQENDGRIAVQLVLLHERIERAFLAMVTELHPLHIEGGCAFAL